METQAPDNPYPGLRPFQANETHLFFGRDEQRIELLSRLRQTRFLSVVGTSGSGKSSLVNAGLLPGLFGGFMAGPGRRWRVAKLRPGSDPLANLADALDQPGALRDEPLGEGEVSFTAATLRRSGLGLLQAVHEARLPPNDVLLVLVDQFEELFRTPDHPGVSRVAEQATAFVRLLLAASAEHQGQVYVVLTMRSDFLGECARFRGLPEAINAGQYLVPRLTRDQLREAITGPAAMQGVSLSLPLIDRLLNDVGGNSDQLPILQHALMRTWDLWRHHSNTGDTLIELDDYEHVGGMRDALNCHADEVLNSLANGCTAIEGSRRLRIAERMFKALVDTNTIGHETRRLMPLRELAAIAQASTGELLAVAAPFRQSGNAFIMPPEHDVLRETDTLDITHESLIRNWRTLQRWRQEEKLSADQYRLLAETAERHRQNKAGLWSEPDLSAAMQWREAQEPNPTWANRYGGEFERAMQFLDESHAHEAITRAERNSHRRVRKASIVIALVLALLGAVSWTISDLALGARQTEQARLLKEELDMWRPLGAALDARQAGAARASIDECKVEGRNSENYIDRLWLQLCNGEQALNQDELIWQYVAIVSLLADAQIEQAVALTEQASGNAAILAHVLMSRIADLRTSNLRTDRRALKEWQANMEGSSPSKLHVKSRKRDPMEFDHPVHRSIATKLAAGDPLNPNETWLLNNFKSKPDPMNGDTTTVKKCTPPNARGDADTVGIDAFFRRLCQANLQPASRLAELDMVLGAFLHDWGSDLLLVLAWPVWVLWRRRQQRLKASFDSPPHPLRRSLAISVDLTVAFFLFCLSAMLADTLADAATGAIWAAIAMWTLLIASFSGGLVYLLLSDALHLRHRRSLGKIAFGLSLVCEPATENQHMGLTRSMRRNATMAACFTLALGLIMVWSLANPGADMDEAEIDLAAAFSVLGITALLITMMRGRTLGDRWSGTRVVDVESIAARQVEISAQTQSRASEAKKQTA